MSTPKVIYLIPNDLDDGEYVWCDDPAPCDEMDPEEAVKYVRADTLGDRCNHTIVDARNEVIKSGYVCTKCLKVFEAGDQET